MCKKEFWFKIEKWGNKKPDFCKVWAEDEKHAHYAMEDQLLGKTHSINCEYFSTKGNYRRKIEDILTYYTVSYSEVKKHMDRIEYAIANK